VTGRQAQARIAFLEAAIAEHERKLEALFETMRLAAEAAGISVAAVQPSRDRHGLYAVKASAS
jgi:hypothetical protein